jgi:hypothetical protein
MYPHPETCAQFKYPRGGLMKFRDFVKDGELRRPTIFDANREECLIVVKNGTSTGVTFGRTTSIESFVCDYKEYRIHSTSMEITIYPYSHKDGAFSAPGGSGSVISDANNRIVGMLTGGAGQTDSTDVTYASQYYFLDERIKKAFPNSHLYPIPPRSRHRYTMTSGTLARSSRPFSCFYVCDFRHALLFLSRSSLFITLFSFRHVPLFMG